MTSLHLHLPAGDRGARDNTALIDRSTLGQTAISAAGGGELDGLLRVGPGAHGWQATVLAPDGSSALVYLDTRLGTATVRPARVRFSAAA
jgi:hypothetical protein